MASIRFRAILSFGGPLIENPTEASHDTCRKGLRFSEMEENLSRGGLSSRAPTAVPAGAFPLYSRYGNRTRLSQKSCAKLPLDSFLPRCLIESFKVLVENRLLSIRGAMVCYSWASLFISFYYFVALARSQTREIKSLGDYCHHPRHVSGPYAFKTSYKSIESPAGGYYLHLSKRLRNAGLSRSRSR